MFGRKKDPKYKVVITEDLAYEWYRSWQWAIYNLEGKRLADGETYAEFSAKDAVKRKTRQLDAIAAGRKTYQYEYLV